MIKPVVLTRIDHNEFFQEATGDFQLTDGCGTQRLDSAKKLLSNVDRDGLPPFRLNPASFSPGPATIQVNGAWWR